MHFCETKLVVARFCNMGVQFPLKQIRAILSFSVVVVLMRDPVILVQGPLTLSYLKQQFEKNTSKIKHRAQCPRERQMLLVSL